jgi:hypothetical protein
MLLRSVVIFVLFLCYCSFFGTVLFILLYFHFRPVTVLLYFVFDFRPVAFLILLPVLLLLLLLFTDFRALLPFVYIC